MDNSEYQDNQDTNGAAETPDDSINPDVFKDGLFTIKISDEMTLRNALRAGLVEAQGKDTDKIPMFVSWPPWLEDGVVCLFAKDLHAVLRKVIRDTAGAVKQDLGVDVHTADLDKTPKPFNPPVVVAPAPEKHKKTAAETPTVKGAAASMPKSRKRDDVSRDFGQKESKSNTLSDQDLADKLFTQIRNELKK